MLWHWYPCTLHRSVAHKKKVCVYACIINIKPGADYKLHKTESWAAEVLVYLTAFSFYLSRGWHARRENILHRTCQSSEVKARLLNTDVNEVINTCELFEGTKENRCVCVCVFEQVLINLCTLPVCWHNEATDWTLLNNKVTGLAINGAVNVKSIYFCGRLYQVTSTTTIRLHYTQLLSGTHESWVDSGVLNLKSHYNLIV